MIKIFDQDVLLYNVVEEPQMLFVSLDFTIAFRD